jgi:hypothetical protein
VLAASGLIDAASGYFDTDWYVQTNPLVERLKINPLVHYILAGEIAGRRPVPYFDPPGYRATYRVPPDQLALTHYLAHRNSQTFSPTPLFDVGWYVEPHRGEITRDPFISRPGPTATSIPRRRSMRRSTAGVASAARAGSAAG